MYAIPRNHSPLTRFTCFLGTVVLFSRFAEYWKTLLQATVKIKNLSDRSRLIGCNIGIFRICENYKKEWAFWGGQVKTKSAINDR